MAKPILTISDFSSGITYDETESTTNGFNDLSNIDIKTTLGVAQLSKRFLSSNGTTLAPYNNMIGHDLIPDINGTGITRQNFYVSHNGDNKNRVYYWDAILKQSVNIYDPATLPGAAFSEIELFQDTFYFNTQPNKMGSMAMWSTGNRYNILADGTTTVVTVGNPAGYPNNDLNKNLTGGTLYYYSGGTWLSVTVNTITTGTGTSTLVVSSTIPTGTYKGYILKNSYNNVLRNDGTSLSLDLPNGTVFYRPMINFINNLYIADGDLICQIDNLKAVLNSTGKNGSISVGSDYTVKQMEKIGGYMYILADNFNSKLYNGTDAVPIMNSKVLIWDGISNEFSNIIDIGTHCFAIKAIENRVYAVIRSDNNDGALFTYFNGSDFPTIAKLQLSNAKCPVNCIAYDRGRFYICANEHNSSDAFIGSYIFSYSAYAIENPSVSKKFAVVTTDTTEKIKGIDMIRTGQIAYLMKFSNSGTQGILYRDGKYVTTGTIQSQKYEITPNQFGQLVRGVQINCKETMPSGTSIIFKYRGDEETNFTQLPTIISSTNQNILVWGINRRYRKIQLQIQLNTSDITVTPKVVKINLF